MDFRLQRYEEKVEKQKKLHYFILSFFHFVAFTSLPDEGSLVGQRGVSNRSIRRVMLPEVACLVPHFGHPNGHFAAQYPPFVVETLNFIDADLCAK